MAGGLQKKRRWDTIVVGVLTPTLVVSTLVGIFLLGQIFYPDPNPPELVFPTPTVAVARPTVVPGATPLVAAPPINTARLNANINERPPPFDWPEVEDFKLVPNPGRPNEQADYTPPVASLELRRLISASTASVILHNGRQFAVEATEELAKAYPVRTGKDQVLDLPATVGYLPDESAFSVVYTYGSYRVHVETTAASPPFKADQLSTVEYHSLHLADHLARRVQEVGSLGRRTGPEALAVHWRDHLSRSLSFRR